MTDFHDDEPDAPAKKKLTQHEWRDQRGYAAFLSKALPIDAYWTAIDVGRSRNRDEGQLRKARGVKAGIPDFLIVWRGVTVWLEIKAGQSLSPVQRTTRDALLANGHKWALCRRVEEIETALLAAGISLRASLGGIQTRIAEQNERLPAKRKRAVRGIKADNSMSLARYHRMHEKGLI